MKNTKHGGGAGGEGVLCLAAQLCFPPNHSERRAKAPKPVTPSEGAMCLGMVLPALYSHTPPCCPQENKSLWRTGCASLASYLSDAPPTPTPRHHPLPGRF